MKNKYDYAELSRICERLLDYIESESSGWFDSRFVDSDGDFVRCDMGYLLDGLRSFETYFELKAEVEK